MNWLYSLAQPFVWHSARAGGVALAFLVLAFALPRRARRALLTAGIAWSVFALLEYEAWREQANIRVDLLFTWPVLVVITVTCAVITARRLGRGGSRSG
jgi:hypothetical protein